MEYGKRYYRVCDAENNGLKIRWKLVFNLMEDESEMSEKRKVGSIRYEARSRGRSSPHSLAF